MEHLHLFDRTNNYPEFTRLQFPVVSSFREWTALPPDLLDLIVTKVRRFSDYLRFCGVCPQWRSTALRSASSHKQSLNLLKASRNKLPMLMIKTEEDNNDMRGLYSISDGITYNLQLPLPCRNRFIGSSHGWLFCVEEREVITLLNPLSNSCISLPLFKDVTHVNWDRVEAPDYYLFKGILTADPHMSPNNYAVAVIYSDVCKLAIYKAGDMHWKFIDLQEHVFSDVICYKSNIYSITVDDKLVQVDIDSGSGKTIIHESNSLPVINYLVESQGELLLVQRYWEIEEDFGMLAIKPEDNDNEDNENEDRETESDDIMCSDTEEFLRNYSSRSITSDYKLFKLVHEKDSAEWVEIDSIGEQALFLGGNQSVSISTLEFPECSSNSIYFTNEYYLWIPPYECNGSDEDSGFFNLDNKSCHSHHLLDLCEWHMKPPIWFVPNLANSA